MFENIQDHFPQVGWIRFKIDVNDANKDYCHKTQLLRKSADLSFTSTTISYTLADEFTDMDKEMIVAIRFYDSDGDLVGLGDTLTWTVVNGVLIFYNYKGDVISSISGVTTITFDYVYVPDTLTAESDESEIPSQFHDALIHNLLSKYYSKFKVDSLDRGGNLVRMVNLGQSNFHNGKYKELIKDGWRYAHQGVIASAQIKANQF